MRSGRDVSRNKNPEAGAGRKGRLNLLLVILAVAMSTLAGWYLTGNSDVLVGLFLSVAIFLGLCINTWYVYWWKEVKDKIRVVIENGKPRVEGVPEGSEVLVLAEIDALFCVIYGPSETCSPKDPGDSCKLLDAKFAVGKEEAEMKICGIIDGIRFYGGGGSVQTEGNHLLSFSSECSMFGREVFDKVHVAF